MDVILNSKINKVKNTTTQNATQVVNNTNSIAGTNLEIGKINTTLADIVQQELPSKADKNEVFTMSNMGQDIKTAMTGGSVAVVGVDAVLTENIVDNQVTSLKTSFMKKNVNLFNKTTVAFGKILDITDNYNLKDNTTCSTSDYIGVKPSITYCLNLQQAIIVFYNSSKVRISHIIYDGNTFNYSFTPPATTAYIRFTIQNYNICSRDKNDICKLEAGSVSTDYTPFGYEEINSVIKNTTISKNLFNIANSIPNKRVITGYDNDLINGTTCTCSSIIFVKPNTTYIINKMLCAVVFYARTYKFISGILGDELKTSFTTPSNCYYLRFSTQDDSHGIDIQLEENIEITEYKAFGIEEIKKDLTNKISINLFDKNRVILGKNLITQYANALTTDALACVSDFIPVKSSTDYYINMPYCNVVFYNVNKAYVGGYIGDMTKTQFTTNATTVYVRFSIWHYATDNYGKAYPRIANCQLEEGTERSKYREFGKLYSETTKDKFTNMCWNSYGDSISEYRTYQDLVNAKLDLQLYRNYGQGGFTIADCTGKSGWLGTIQTWVTNSSKNYTIATIMGGTNDHGWNVALDNVNEKFDRTTFKGSIRWMIKYLQELNPTQRIMFFTPIPRFLTGANTIGLFTLDYVNAMKEACGEYKIPCVDLYTELGVNEYNYTLYYRDTVHPNDEKGFLLLENLICDAFNKYL